MIRRALIVLLTLCGCRSTELKGLPPEGARLPFEVMMIVDVECLDEEGDADVRMSIDQEQLESSLTASVLQDLFVDLTSDAVAGQTADLLLRAELTYSPRVSVEPANALFALPLFFFGGPLSLFYGTREYAVDASFEWYIYNLSRKSPDRVLRGAPLLGGRFTPPSVELGLVDRMGGVARSSQAILWPATYLGVRSSRVGDALEERLLELLAQTVARELWREEGSALLLPSFTSPLGIDLDRVRIQPAGSGTQVSLDVLSRDDAEPQVGCFIQLGENSSQSQTLLRDDDSRYQRGRVLEVVEASFDESERMKVALRSSGAGHVRTFTFSRESESPWLSPVSSSVHSAP